MILFLCTLYPNTNILMCAQITGSFSSFFRTLICPYHNIFQSCGSQDHLIDWFNWFRSIACFTLWYVFVTYRSFAIFWFLSIVCLPPTICMWICVFYSTHIFRNTHFMEEHILYWPSKFFAHFGNRCQWGRSLESLEVWKAKRLFVFMLWFCS